MDAQLQTLIKVVAFLAVIYLCAGASYRAYFHLSRRAAKSQGRLPARILIQSLPCCLPLLSTWLVTLAACRFVDRIPLRAIGLVADPTAWRQVGVGAAVGLAGVTLLFLIGRAGRWLHVQPADISKDFRNGLPTFCSTGIYLVGLAIAEELIFRGYVFSLLHRSGGAAAGLIGSAALFAVFHLVVQLRLPALYLLNTFLFGLVAAHLRLATGALWAPIGLHVGWNLADYSVYGFPFSTGGLNRRGLISCVVMGPRRITGADLGPEAGLIGSAVIAFTGAVLAILYVAS